MIHATLRIPVADQALSDSLLSLRRLVGPASAAPGCLHCRLYREVGEAESLLLDQHWASDSALQAYLRTEDYRQLLNLLEAACDGPPEIRFETVSQSRGLELIERARGSDSN